MKIIVFSNHRAILPVLEHFHHNGWVQAVISTDRLQGQNLQIRDYCNQSDIKTGFSEELSSSLNPEFNYSAENSFSIWQNPYLCI